ncbi:tyrosine--tRNA ligase [Candidatus Woesearchaeota archaeon]|nr:tyrosine--tRNA ligase [Candidatus Woesearchaeota archaeon]MBL7050567.1 tyrosine--tRNA ligase [Candidatus Woesearchaeota archaeon]
MELTKRFDLIKEVGEEIIKEDELKELLKTKKNPIAYDGFEPSGKIHIAQGLLRAININKMITAGCKFKMWVADWHAWANNKFDGDLEKIQTCGEYFIEVWKATGMDMTKVDFVWANKAMRDVNYWKTVMQVARNSTVKRITRCGQIMGRKEGESLQASQIFYPCMQAADIFYLNVDIAQLGMDQRKVNVLARELGPKLGFWKPIAVHHHMLMGLGQPPKGTVTTDRVIAMKMSKSNPDSAIFMTDTTEEVNRKLNKAYCPEGVIEENPVLEYCKYIVFEKIKEFKITRPEKFGGNISFKDYNGLETAFKNKKVHPMDLKTSTARYINELLEPVRNHFKTGKPAKLLKQVQGFEITK